jgi:hypothetical protein
MGASCLPGQQTSVILRNNTSFPVDVELFYDDEQDIPEVLLEENGTRLTFTLAPGEAQSFSRPCEDLQAVFINDADMRIAPGISPEASTRVYREPDDFTCGNTLTFTFTAANLGTSLEISFSQQQ